MMNDRRKTVLLIVAVMCVGFFIGDRVVISPLMGLWKANSSKIKLLRQDIDRGRQILDREKALNEHWEEMRGKSFPGQTAATENQVLSSISQWARSADLSVTSLRPRWMPNAKPFQKIEVRLSAIGSLEAVARFLHAFETAPQAQRIEEISIASRDERGGQITLDMRFTGLAMVEKQQ